MPFVTSSRQCQMTVDNDGDAGVKLRHSLEPNKYPYVSPSQVSISDNEDISDTARYPLVKVHGTLNWPLSFACTVCRRRKTLTKYSSTQPWFRVKIKLF